MFTSNKTYRRSTRRKRVPDRLGDFVSTTPRSFSRRYRGGVETESVISPVESRKRKRSASTIDTEPPISVDQFFKQMVGRETTKQRRAYEQSNKQQSEPISSKMRLEIGRYEFTVFEFIEWLRSDNRRVLRSFLAAAYEPMRVLFDNLSWFDYYSQVLKGQRPKFLRFLMQVVEALLPKDQTRAQVIEQNVRILLSKSSVDEAVEPWNTLHAAIRQWNWDFVDLTIALSQNESRRWNKIWTTHSEGLVHYLSMATTLRDSNQGDVERYEMAILLNLWSVLSSRGVMIYPAQVLSMIVQNLGPSLRQPLLDDLQFFLTHHHHPTVEPRLAYSLLTYQEYSSILRELKRDQSTSAVDPLIQYLIAQHPVWYPDFHRNLLYLESLSVADREVVYLWTEHCGVLQAGSRVCNVSAYTRQRLDTILTNAPRTEHTFYVYRGVRADSIDEASATSLSRTDQYLTTSFDLKIAWEFTKEKPCCIYRIRVQKDTPFLLIDERMSAFKDEASESEIIFPRGLFYLASNVAQVAEASETAPTLAALQNFFHYESTNVPLYDFDLLSLQQQQQQQHQRVSKQHLSPESEQGIWIELVRHVTQDIAQKRTKSMYGVFDSIRIWQLKWYGTSVTHSDEEEHEAFRQFARPILEKLPDVVFEGLKLTREQAHEQLNNYKLYKKVARFM